MFADAKYGNGRKCEKKRLHGLDERPRRNQENFFGGI
jgi:hypothetical protein